MCSPKVLGASILGLVSLVLFVLVHWQSYKFVDPIEHNSMPKQAVLLFKYPMVPVTAVSDMRVSRADKTYSSGKIKNLLSMPFSCNTLNIAKPSLIGNR